MTTSSVCSRMLRPERASFSRRSACSICAGPCGRPAHPWVGPVHVLRAAGYARVDLAAAICSATISNFSLAPKPQDQLTVVGIDFRRAGFEQGAGESETEAPVCAGDQRY